ncbi:MAG TPA: LPXTG cell wall anchor domain-containing protein [Flavobacteriaceae bacterium]|nr:LPXTG cell wall anchor domain-containing protein [Flavobacteriaceae bacterium]
MSFQQPSELPQPTPSPPDQQFGAYSLEYFVRENWLYLLGVLVILILVFGFWFIRSRRQKPGE